MDLVCYGQLSYEEAIEALVVSKHKESESYKQQLINRMELEGPPPLIICGVDCIHHAGLAKRLRE
jgi:phosphopantetheine adenylyltransferase